MPEKEKSFSFKARLHSFKYAFAGIVTFFRTQHNAIIHLFIALIAVITGLWLSVSETQWLFIVIAIGMVFSAEIMNTAIEKIADMVTLEQNETIKKIKDLSAAAVLVTAVTSAFIGLIIFIPPLLVKIGLLH